VFGVVIVDGWVMGWGYGGFLSLHHCYWRLKFVGGGLRSSWFPWLTFDVDVRSGDDG
jgi:hypothetical protein